VVPHEIGAITVAPAVRRVPELRTIGFMLIILTLS
jgi:hypothetical protein